MFRSSLNPLALGAGLWAFGWLGEGQVDPLVRAAAGVMLAIAMAALAFGQTSFLPVAVGAISPLAFALLEKRSLGWATWALCLLWMAPRLVLAPTPRRLILVAILTLAAAGVAGITFATYIDGPTAAHLASCVFAGSCLSLVGLVPVDTGIAVALRAAATVIESPAREAIERAAGAHRQSAGRTSKSEMWRMLLRLADQRAALATTGAPSHTDYQDLDDRIEALAEELAPPHRISPGPTE